VKILQILWTDGSEAKSWQDGMYILRGELMVTLERSDKDVLLNPYIELTIKAPVNQLFKMWALCCSLCRTMESVMKETPHVLHDKIYKCPHCLLLKRPEPKKFDVYKLLNPCKTLDQYVTCGEPKVPTGLVYPVFSGK